MNSCAAISGFEAPSPARRAISASCAVRVSGISVVCCRACPPAARNSVRARLANAPAPMESQPLTVQQAGASQIHPQASAAEAVDRLAVQVLGGGAVADQRPRAGLGTNRPVGPAGGGDAGDPLQGAGREL